MKQVRTSVQHRGAGSVGDVAAGLSRTAAAEASGASRKHRPSGVVRGRRLTEEILQAEERGHR